MVYGYAPLHANEVLLVAGTLAASITVLSLTGPLRSIRLHGAYPLPMRLAIVTGEESLRESARQGVERDGQRASLVPTSRKDRLGRRGSHPSPTGRDTWHSQIIVDLLE